MTRRGARAIALIVLGAAIVVLAIVLRRHGGEWGLPSAAGFAISGHPDEWFVLDSMRAMNVAQGDLLSKEAYVEGPLQHMMWALLLPVAKRVGWIDRTPDEFARKDGQLRAQRAQVLRFLRATVVAVDVVAIVVLVTLGASLFGAPAALLAALVYAVLPAFVVHAHYARTHALADLLLVLVSLTCLTIERRWRTRRARSLVLWGVCGVFTALAAATRYHMLSVALFPGMLALSWWRDRLVLPRDRLLAPAVLFAGFVFGLLLGIPAIVVAPHLLRDGLAYTVSFAQAEEFSGASLLSLDRVWVYLHWLIPVGTYPALWAVLYLAALSALVVTIKRRAIVAMALPLYAIIYLYLTAKGYAQPVFVRAALPFMTVCVLALAYVVKQLERRAWMQAVAVVAVVAVCVPSTRYAWAYGTGMSDSDPRYKAAAWIKKNVPRDLPVGIVSPYPWYFTPPIKQRIVSDALHQSTVPRWLVVSSFEAKDANAIAPGFAVRQEFRTLPRLGKRMLDLEHWPDDWMYPFPTVWVLERRGE